MLTPRIFGAMIFMLTSMRSFFRTPSGLRLSSFFPLIALMSLGAMLSACNDTGWPDRDPTVLENVGADALNVWPPIRYALPGDVLTVEVRKLKTIYSCAHVLSMTPVVTDSASWRFISITANVELPGTPDCPRSTGLDTTFESTVPAAGSIILKTPNGLRTDSVTIISGTGVVEEFLHVRSNTDTTQTFNRFTFRDSTAGHPLRTLSTTLLAPCEVFQAAVFERINAPGTPDTLSIKFRTLLASPALPDTVSPACAGVYGGSYEVVPNRYGYP
jgi:hypothetical protein